MKHIVSGDWLVEQLQNPDVRAIDCRFDLGNPGYGLNAYLQDHVPGAFYFDMEKDLSGPKGVHGGRHPLPELEGFADKLSAAGIDEAVKVVAYDDQGGMMAARFWWLLKYLGHSEVYVLDDGYSGWKAKGYPVSTEIPHVPRRQFVPRVQREWLAEMEEVRQKLGKEGTVLIDARDPKRYRGEEDPIDAVAGHIPGALNYFWKGCLREDGGWKTPGELKERFKALNPADEVIVYCGSGISACPNVLALKEAGFERVKLYLGSWSDWSSYPENPIEKG